jgi:hypothetical protein
MLMRDNRKFLKPKMINFPMEVNGKNNLSTFYINSILKIGNNFFYLIKN